MSSNVVLHPVLEYFFNCFKEKERDGALAGYLIQSMDEFSVNKSLNFKGGYLVCAEKIEFSVSRFIHFTGPGGGLIAAKSVELEGPDVSFVGSQDDPIQIVALENINIQATDLKVQNVVFYLFNDATFSMNTSVFSKVENVRVARLKIEDQTIIEEEVACWEDENALAAWINHQKPLPRQEGILSEDMEALLERLEWEREAAREIGRRSLLV